MGEAFGLYGKSDTVELKGIEVSIADQSLLTNFLSYLTRSRGVCKDICRCMCGMTA